MGWKRRVISIFYLSICLVVLQGCLTQAPDAQSNPGRKVSERGEPTLPPAVPGNILVAINDEAPVIRNSFGEPIRQDREAQGHVVNYKGFSEE